MTFERKDFILTVHEYVKILFTGRIITEIMIHFAAKIERNDPCWCGSGKKYKSCHMRFDEKLKGFQLKGHIVPDRSIIKTPEQVQGIRESAKVNMACLDAVAAAIRPGMSTEEIDKIVYDTTVSMNAIPAPLHYEGFPKSVCTSINEEVCHGIPDEVHILKEGDIINVDCSTIKNGYFSDSSRMFCIGEVSQEKKRLVQVTKECVEIGLEFHEDPFVSYVSRPGEEMLMVPGMVFTIEPMVNMGTDDIYQDDKNGWTIYTRDGKPSAQWEIQVLVTETGHEVLCW